MKRYLDEFMAAYKFEGLTFDDISLVTQYADFLPDEACLQSKFSRNVKLNIPLISAAMDTVTERKMAIAMAQLGGLGIIHKNLTIERQVDEVHHVKHYLNGIIKNPVCFNANLTIEEMLNAKRINKYNFSGFPIIDNNNKLIGILSAQDIKYVTDYKLTIAEVMTSNVISIADGASMKKAYETMLTNKIGKLPSINKDNEITGLYSFTDIKSLMEKDEPDFNRDAQHQLRVGAAVGPYDEARATALVEAGVDVLVLDTAHGHSKGVIDTLKLFKDSFGDKVDVVAGNVATREAAKALSDAGADGIKVGIGPGSICTTRVVAGVGVPQLSAVYEVSQGAASDIPIIADGGIKQSGDLAKAIAVGADCIMMGSALAGTAESTGENILHNGRSYVVYRGMGSLEAMKTGKGSRERYGQSDVDTDNKLVPQGIEGMVPFRGSVSNVIIQLTGGLRYSLGYCGTKNITELKNNAKMVRVSSAGLREAHPHDVTLLKDAPNYTSQS